MSVLSCLVMGKLRNGVCLNIVCVCIRRGIGLPLLSHSNGCITTEDFPGQDQETGAQVSHVGSTYPCTWATFYFLLRSISKELGLKQSDQDSCRFGMRYPNHREKLNSLSHGNQSLPLILEARQTFRMEGYTRAHLRLTTRGRQPLS